MGVAAARHRVTLAQQPQVSRRSRSRPLQGGSEVSELTAHCAGGKKGIVQAYVPFVVIHSITAHMWTVVDTGAADDWPRMDLPLAATQSGSVKLAISCKERRASRFYGVVQYAERFLMYAVILLRAAQR